MLLFIIILESKSKQKVGKKGGVGGGLPPKYSYRKVKYFFGGGKPPPPPPFSLDHPPPPPFMLYLNSSLLATFYTLSFIDYTPLTASHYKSHERHHAYPTNAINLQIALTAPRISHYQLA